jgi:hypothetical protein
VKSSDGRNTSNTAAAEPPARKWNRTGRISWARAETKASLGENRIRRRVGNPARRRTYAQTGKASRNGGNRATLRRAPSAARKYEQHKTRRWRSPRCSERNQTVHDLSRNSNLHTKILLRENQILEHQNASRTQGKATGFCSAGWKWNRKNFSEERNRLSGKPSNRSEHRPESCGRELESWPRTKILAAACQREKKSSKNR